MNEDELKKWRKETIERIIKNGPYHRGLNGPPWNPPSTPDFDDETFERIRPKPLPNK